MKLIVLASEHFKCLRFFASFRRAPSWLCNHLATGTTALRLIKKMTFTCQIANLCANKDKFKMLCYSFSKHIECRGIVDFVHWNSNLQKIYTIFHNDHRAILKFYLGAIVSSLSFFTSDRVILSIWRNLQSEYGNFDRSF